MRFSTSICMKSRSTFPGKYFSFPFHVQNNMKCQQSSETRLQTVLQISDPCLKDEWPFKVRKKQIEVCESRFVPVIRGGTGKVFRRLHINQIMIYW